MHLILMGAPGSGKGTYAAVLKKHYRVPHISTGEIFREAIANKTPMGLIAKTYIDEGNLVPDDITNEIVKRLRILQPGNFIAFGSAFKIPVLVRIDMPDPAPSSNSCEISKMWFVEKR